VHITRNWKTAGVAVGTAALVASTTAAYACTTGDGTTAVRAASTSYAGDFDDFDVDFSQAQVLAAEEHALATLQSWVSAVQARVANLGSPSTLTPRQAWKIKATLGFIGFLQARLASLPTSGANALPAADVATVNSLQSELDALAAKLRSVLANATIVRPAVKAADGHLFDKARVFGLRARHHCDGFHWDGYRSYDGTHDRYRDGDHHYDGHYGWH